MIRPVVADDPPLRVNPHAVGGAHHIAAGREVQLEMPHKDILEWTREHLSRQ
jgi:hypothetical protein